MAKQVKSTPRSKRYRWTPATAPERFNALSAERQKDFEQALAMMRRSGVSGSMAAKAKNISRENLMAYVRAYADVEVKPGRAIRVVRDNRPVSFKVITPDGEVLIDATGEEAMIAKAHREAINQAKKLRVNAPLLPWRRKFITDRKGVRHQLLADRERIYELFPPDEFNPASIYAYERSP